MINLDEAVARRTTDHNSQHANSIVNSSAQQPLAVSFGDEYGFDFSLITYFTFTQHNRVVGNAVISKPCIGNESDLDEFYPLIGLGVPRGTRLGTRAFISLCDCYAQKHGYEHVLTWAYPTGPARDLLGAQKMNVPSLSLPLADWKKYALHFVASQPRS